MIIWTGRALATEIKSKNEYFCDLPKAFRTAYEKYKACLMAVKHLLRD
jgi:hypothetical protein